MDLTSPVLEGSRIRLEPLSLDHHAQLCEAGLDEEIWHWAMSPISTPEQMRREIETALQWRSEGTAIPFATIERASGRAIGSTRFANIDRRNRRVEIGWTWIGRAWQRTAVNTEAKYLMLRHAFEKVGCMRVEFKADALNERSRKALLRIGATQEGILRNHMLADSGRIRDSVYFSVIDSEWPGVKAKLESMLWPVRQAGASELEVVRSMWQDHQLELGIDLGHGNFDRVLVAFAGNQGAGTVSLDPTADGAGEVKRLYVRPAFRKLGLGRSLMRAAVAEAERAGYSRLRLHTLPGMTEAVSLYRALGFSEIEPYESIPFPGALFLGRELTGATRSPMDPAPP